jgi:hypothetical protein
VTDRRLRRDCATRLAEIAMPADCDVDGLCALVSRLRGRPIHRMPVPVEASHPCGFWIATDEADLILYEGNTSRAHQEHIVVHELAHMICGHRGGAAGGASPGGGASTAGGTAAIDDGTARLLFPDLDPRLVRDMLGRAGYTDRQEREAEVMASIIMERLSRRARRPGDPGGVDDPGGGDEVARIERVLTYRNPHTGA